jgi:hypothetical protein
MPGCTQIGTFDAATVQRDFHDVAVRHAEFRAVLRLTSTALSHVILVMGSGNSCIQPLFA